MYEQFLALPFKRQNREWWRRGYYVDTAGKNERKIEEHIKISFKRIKRGNG